MSSRFSVGVLLLCGLLCGAAFVALQAAAVSEQQADAFDKKMAIVRQQGTSGIRGQSPGPRRTPFSETEVNSWFAYRSGDVLPTGVSDPQITIIGNGKVRAAATVDLETIAKRRSSGRALDPWSYLGGKLPVTLTGVLRTQNGIGNFELEEAAVSGVPVPTSVLQDIVAYYSRTADDPQGVRLNDPFKLPSQIKQIEVGQGQAVVVQ